MGSNMSTVHETEATKTCYGLSSKSSSTNNNQTSQVRESRGPALACAAFPSQFKAPTRDIESSGEFAIHRKPAGVALSGHTANTNRVIAFHSSASWREYFEASKQTDKLMVIYFTASWCAPCRYMAPILEEFAAQYADVEFDKIDVDELFGVSEEFGVQAMPTFLFVKGGKVINKVTGAKREELQGKIEKHRA